MLFLATYVEVAERVTEMVGLLVCVGCREFWHDVETGAYCLVHLCSVVAVAAMECCLGDL